MKPSVPALLALLCAARAVSADSLGVPSFNLPDPTAPPRTEILESTASPTYYRLPPKTTHFLSRSSLGAHTRLTGETDTAFSFDALMGAVLRFDRRSSTALWIEGGYSYVRGREHLAMLGMGVGYHPRGIASPLLAVIPHVVAGTIDGETSLGVRTSVIVGFAMYSLELAHQVGFLDGNQVHEIHAAFTFPFLAGFE